MEKLNFKKFSSELKRTQRNSLLLVLLKDAGIVMRTEENSLIFEQDNIEKANDFFMWLKEKEEFYAQKNSACVERL